MGHNPFGDFARIHDEKFGHPCVEKVVTKCKSLRLLVEQLGKVSFQLHQLFKYLLLQAIILPLGVIGLILFLFYENTLYAHH
jgi:hypothetical protein